MAQQTATQWFNQQLVDRQNGNGDSRSLDEIFDVAQKMEKWQKVAFAKNCINKVFNLQIGTSYEDIEQFYNETYNK
jgi:hypothetical protein